MQTYLYYLFAEHDEINEKQVEAPPEMTHVDRGWAWVILFSSFMCNFFIWGSIYANGIYNVSFLIHFGEKKSVTAWIGSIQIGLVCLTGV